MLLAESRCDWQHLAALCGSSCNEKLRSVALYNAATPVDLLNLDTQYQAAVEFLQHAATVSYPKK